VRDQNVKRALVRRGSAKLARTVVGASIRREIVKSVPGAFLGSLWCWSRIISDPTNWKSVSRVLRGWSTGSVGACDSESSSITRHVHVHQRTMAGLRHVCQFLVLLNYLPALVLVLAQNPVEDKTTFEAAFQGKPVSVHARFATRRSDFRYGCRFYCKRKQSRARLKRNTVFLTKKSFNMWSPLFNDRILVNENNEIGVCLSRRIGILQHVRPTDACVDEIISVSSIQLWTVRLYM